MQLEQMDIVLRPRSRWEAIDLGIQLARRHYLRLWLLWWLSALPVTLIICVLLYDHPDWISTAVWWFKPLFEPILVFWLGRAIFGERLGYRATIRQWWFVTRKRLLANLLWRRLSPNRSYLMPVTVLERSAPAAWRERAGELLRGGSGAWLTVIGAHFEFVLMLGLLMVGVMLVPTELLPDWDWQDRFDESNLSMAWLLVLVALIAMSLFAPFYVAGGFVLYLSTRTALEAWDIELDFRRLLHRLAPVLPALVLIVFLPLATPGPALAQNQPQADFQRDQVRSIVDEILAHEDFGGTETVTRWEWGSESESRPPAISGVDLSWLPDLMQLMLWVGVGVFAAWLLAQAYRYRDQWRWRWRWRRRGSNKSSVRAEVRLTVADELPPGQVLQRVQELLQQGAMRDALALLYRASLSVLVRRDQLELRDSATEGECLALVVNNRPAEEAEFFSRLTRHWMAVAYAGRVPGRDAVEQLLKEWQHLYESQVRS